ncbi:hypothetical protein NP493_232g00016 [Ridgeia piscesae]|uniref:acetate--CoA ligase n=1 Tax=Ridgeia piscesae TaxID=27915 RepID=A0AAD9NZU4_RIDPI|nr:hypothetical protein NP493_232g00016 [Ridgeia piscesae]
MVQGQDGPGTGSSRDRMIQGQDGEGNDPDDEGKITYSGLLTQVCKFANVLKAKGVKKGDRVAIYMPMITEIVIAMLACARIGAVHSIVFAGYSLDALALRIVDAQATVLVVGDGVWRGTKVVSLKQIADGAMHMCEEQGHAVKTCIVVRHLSPDEETVINDGGADGDCDDNEIAKRPYMKLKVHWNTDRDTWWHEEMAKVGSECEPEWMKSEDPLFLLYTSGSTGKPKGILHTCGGYMIYSATTFKYVFDLHDDDVFWCTADVGWITGHTYVTYGPLACGATGLLFEGTPFYPDAGRFWAIIEKYKITKFYTAPTAIRSLMKHGDEHVKKYNLDTLKILGTVGEPINPEAWLWYHRVVGKEKCAIVDTFWQTETTFPFFGVVPELVTEEGKLIEGAGEGYLVFRRPWPGIMQTVYGNHERFETTYFKKFPGFYCTGDGARRDKDGYLWVTGRIDDMLNVSGHLLSTSEVESALVEHHSVAEAAVVAHPHDIKGEALYCFITLKDGAVYTEELEGQLRTLVRTKIGPFAQPDFMQEAPSLPKTRSGKIMRRVLRKIAIGDRNLGDVSTMADESVVQLLFNLRPKGA